MDKNKILKVSLTANLIEWYEFIVSAYLATTMGHVFFYNSSHSDILATLQFFSVFALSYLIRPIGCVFWGMLGDKYGSALALKWSLVLMSVPAFIIGILPGYNQIGYIATGLFILLRLIQGFAAGGEFPLLSVYVFDKSSQYKKANMFCSFVNFSGMMGLLLASITITLLHLAFTEKTIADYAWRVPFLLSLPLFLVILKIRKSIPTEKPQDNSNKFLPSIVIKPLLKTTALIGFVQINMYVLFVWLPTYLTIFLKVSKETAHISNMIAMATLTIFTITFGYIGTKISYKKIIPLSALGLIVLVYPCFYALIYKNEAIIYLVQVFFALILSPIQGTFLYAMNDLFGNYKKNLSLALGYTIPSAVFGGLTPVICSFFISKLNYLEFPGLLITILGVLVLPVLFTL
ncbi:MAG: sugar transporter family protein [Burkholderiales bacterium]|jgi:MHS family proline/betaine transporter-like MFS transporter|nr:sugar transporter family protein [Burkholderiales bacterium]